MDPKILVEYINNVTVVTLTDEKILEDVDIKALEESLLPLIDQNSGLHMILNFKDVKFLSSAVLGLLIRVSKKVFESDGQLRLCSIDPKIAEIFRITRLDKVFDICADVDEAAASLD
ncbi:MAG: STAS domain-containing protein [Anaerohalosphaera sp.]|nr:STAS domain-containing protein [Anaerohalosphaera sp.]